MKVFFDLDGTLISAKRRCHSVYSDLLSYGGFDVLGIDAYWNLKKQRVPEAEIVIITATNYFFETFYKNIRIELIESFDYLLFDSVFVGVRDTLRELSVNNDLYLITLRLNTKTLHKQLHFINIHKYFTSIYNCSSDKHKSIKHEISDPADCVIVGDTELDIEAGKFLNIKTVAVTSGIRTEQLLTQSFPDFLLDSVNDLKGVLNV